MYFLAKLLTSCKLTLFFPSLYCFAKLLTAARLVHWVIEGLVGVAVAMGLGVGVEGYLSLQSNSHFRVFTE